MRRTRVLLGALLSMSIGACAHGGGAEPWGIDLESEEIDGLVKLGIGDVQPLEANHWKLLDDHDVQRGEVIVEAGGSLVSVLQGRRVSLVDDSAGTNVSCDDESASARVACGHALEAGRIVQTAAQRAATPPDQVGRQSEEVCSAATEDRIYNAYFAYQARCQGWGYYGAIWHRSGCMIYLDRCY